MQIRFATNQEIDNWNNIVVQNPTGGNILQGKEFVSIKQRAGWKPRYILSDTCGIVALEKSIPFLGRHWYCPKGPNVESIEQLASLLPELRSFAKEHGIFSVKIEPEIDHTIPLNGLGLIKTTPVQYNYATVLVDLTPPLDDILKGLNQKGRHAIRRAERDGVVIKKVAITDETCQQMYELFKQTSKGAGFAIRPADYYRHFYKQYGDNGALFFAYYEDTLVAGAFAMVQGEKSMYKDGASVRERTAYGASHLLQWEVIKWAKGRGSKEHDLAGVPPIAQIKNPNHPFYGLGRFKTSFNKTVTEYIGAYDIPIKPLQATLWHRYIERVVRKIHFKRHHESYY